MFNPTSMTFVQRLLLLLIIFVPLLSLTVIHYTNQYRASLYEAEKEKVVGEVRAVYSVIDSYNTMAESGLISEGVAKGMALSLIKSERYSRDHYFWVQDEQSNMIVHAINSKISDQNMASTKDVLGYPLFSEMSQLGREKGQGFVHYLAKKPGGGEPLPKTAYIQNYRPWGWIIGSGVYTNDIDSQVRSAIAKIIAAGVFLFVLLSLLTSTLFRNRRAASAQAV